MYESIKNGDTVIIATASPLFAVQELFSAEVKVIGKEFHCFKNICNEKSDEYICYGEKKAEMVRSYLKKENITNVDVAYSDDESDMPFLMLAQESFLTKNNKLINKVKT